MVIMTAWWEYGLLNLSSVQNAGSLLLGDWDLACQHLRCENQKTVMSAFEM